MNITMSEVLQELEAVVSKARTKDGFNTVQEMMDVSGWGMGKVRKTLMALKKQGRLEVSKADRENLAGKLNAVNVYRILPAKKGKR